MEKSSLEAQVWNENLDKLKEYYSEFKNFNVPKNWIKDRQLSRWVENIRTSPNQLPIKLYNDLQQIGFNFKFSTDWDTMYYKLEEFYNKNGHSLVPARQKEYEDLFDWTISQRKAKSLLSPLQQNKLDALEFEWTHLTSKERKWEMIYQELIKFKETFGHVKVPQDYKENKVLGRWVSSQRKYKNAGELSKERIQKLNRLGFLWSEDISRMWDEAWQVKYDELTQYKIANGHIDRIKIRNDNYHLGLWMESQIVAMARNLLPKYRRDKLNAIDFNWERGDFRGDRWNELYQRLKEYKDKHGHCQVKRTEDFRLAVWLQRNKRDKKKISDDKREKLEQLGIK